MEESETVWNADGAEFYILFEIKKKFVNALEVWDLKDAYWKIRLFRMELDAALGRGERNKYLQNIEEEQVKEGKKAKKETEKVEIDNKQKLVDEYWVEFSSKFNPTEEDKSTFYQVLESFYMHLCLIMKKHRMYFREGDDNRLAVLKR
jgi:hypothetical protein